jgi:hypothetical protein
VVTTRCQGGERGTQQPDPRVAASPDQLTYYAKQRDSRLAIAINDRLGLSPLHSSRFAPRPRVPALGERSPKTPDLRGFFEVDDGTRTHDPLHGKQIARNDLERRKTREAAFLHRLRGCPDHGARMLHEPVSDVWATNSPRGNGPKQPSSQPRR